jgi:serine/threonine-protein kinase
MIPSLAKTTADTPGLDEAIAEYLEGNRSGKASAPQEFLRRYPHLAGELRSFFADLAHFDQLAGSLPPAPYGPLRPAAAVAPDATLPGNGTLLSSRGLLKSAQIFGDFEVLGELGRGGMGVVYKARQRSLNRMVALKMILTGEHSGPRERARFRAEAEAVARLQHPNIVQIYEVGELQDRPYFALEYVDGGSLSQRIGGKPQATRQAAALTETLARAMHYAHQQGIVHRDLKPGNVLLTARGMPKITDFGLAKRLETTDGDTKTGAVLGTPGYIAPEQAAGRKDIGPAVDIYALGAILYEQLTGRPPFRGETPLDTMLQVMSQEPTPPTQLCPRVPRDLETICQKCLQKDPAKRYPSANALADDLRRFLTGESIQARPVSTAERLWRWCKRRPLVAGLLASLAVLLVCGVAGITWQWRRAEHQRAVAVTNADETDKQRREAVELRRQAERQRAIAEENYQKARKVVDEFFTRVSEEKLLDVPGLQPLRKELLESALKYYREFLKEHGNDPALKADVAATQLRMAKLLREIGSRAEALKAAEQSLALREELAKADPKDSKRQRELAETYTTLGKLQGEGGQVEAAKRSVQKAQQLLDPLVKAKPTDLELQEQLSLIHDAMGVLHRNAGRTADAIQSYSEARKVFERLVKERPTQMAYRNLAACDLNLAVLYKLQSRLDDSARCYKDAKEVLESLHQANPASPQITRDLAGVYNNLGGLLGQQGKPSEALAYFQQARAMTEQLVRDNPSVPQYQHDLAANHANIGRMQLSDPAEALASFQKAQAILDRVYAANPDLLQVQHDLATVNNYLGDLYLQTGKPAEGLRAYQDACTIGEKYVRAHPDNLTYRSDLGRLEHKLAIAYDKQGKRDEAVRTFRQAIEHQEFALSRAPNESTYRSSLSTHYARLGNLLRRMGRPGEAAAVSRERKQLWPRQPNELYQVACELAECVALVGKGKAKLTPPEEAERRSYTTEAIQTLRQAVDNGFRGIEQLRTAPELASLRSQAEFQKLQKELEQKVKGSGR